MKAEIKAAAERVAKHQAAVAAGEPWRSPYYNNDANYLDSWMRTQDEGDVLKAGVELFSKPDAFLALTAEGEVYKIKPLEWHEITRSSTWEFYSASTTFGVLAVCGYINTATYKFTLKGADMRCDLPTLEAAKEAAEQWYRVRILPALSALGAST